MDDKEKENQTQDTNDYYEALKNESYKSMLNSEVQASVARDQAMKYTNNQINAAGYGTQGLAQSTNLGIQNTYQEALRNAAETHQANLLSINESQHEAELAEQEKLAAANNDEFQSLTTLMSNAASSDQLDTILARYGVTPNEDGTFVYGKGSEFLNDRDKRQLETIYDLYKTNYSNEGSFGVYNNVNALKNMQFELTGVKSGKDDGDKVSDSNGEKNVHQTGNIASFGQWFGREAEMLMYKAESGAIEKNAVIKVTNGNNDTVYLEWTGSGFKQVNSSAYSSATKKHELTHSDGKNNWK